MFEKPSPPRSGSDETRMYVWDVMEKASKLDDRLLDHMTGKQLREIEYEASALAARARRRHGIRLEQSHRNGAKS